MSDIDRKVLESVYGVERAINRLNETLAHLASQFDDKPQDEFPEGLTYEQAAAVVEDHRARMRTRPEARVGPFDNRTAGDWRRLYEGKCLECDALHNACNAEAARADKARKVSAARLKEIDRLERILRERDAGR